jgi:tellurite resistance protein TehA-like permease
MAIWSDRIKPEIEKLNPAYFALVMATGIVSLAGHFLGAPFISKPLLWMNVGFYSILWMLFVLRMIISPSSFFGDFTNFQRGPGFFTVIAGTCILGSQFSVILKADGLASWILYTGIGLWLFIVYTIFFLFTIWPEKPPLQEGIDGAWLVATVGTQSISILSSLLSAHFPLHSATFLFIGIGFFFAGIFLYMLVIMLIFYRWIYLKIKPKEVDPTYWINMGAVAISTLAGATLAEHSSRALFLEGLHQFLVAFTIMLWATATWWIPLLVLLGLWKYLYSGEKFTYTPKYWGMVFPLGMYTTCTFNLHKITSLDFIFYIAHYFYFFAVIAWTLTFLGMLNNLGKIFFPRFYSKQETR